MPLVPDTADELQFNTLEPMNTPVNAASAARILRLQHCAQCRQPIRSTYFAVRQHLLCPNCAASLGGRTPTFNPLAILFALVMGIGAGLLGTVIWYGVRRIFHAEIGLIAVLVGFLVGKAVRKGSGGRGGLVYQVMAVLLTYICIAANYVPDVIHAMRDGTTLQGLPTPFEILFAFWISIKLPFLGGMQGAIGLLIIGFALWEAWKFTKFYRIPLTGPYQLAPQQLAPLQPLSPSPGPDAQAGTSSEGSSGVII